MFFDSPQALASHQQKFCLNSKYGRLDTLTHEYTQLQVKQGHQPRLL
jgi:hypothetical protein